MVAKAAAVAAAEVQVVAVVLPPGQKQAAAARECRVHLALEGLVPSADLFFREQRIVRS